LGPLGQGLSTRRLAVSRWRKTRNAVAAMGRAHRGQSSPDRSAEVVVRDELVQALQTLPGRQRTAVVLHYLCDLDIATVAEETGSSVSAVKSQLMRGRRAMAAQLEPEPGPAAAGRLAEPGHQPKPESAPDLGRTNRGSYAQNGLS
jgi:RNA polymerase sigma-70 factor, ECF subfamily